MYLYQSVNQFPLALEKSSMYPYSPVSWNIHYINNINQLVQIKSNYKSNYFNHVNYIQYIYQESSHLICSYSYVVSQLAELMCIFLHRKYARPGHQGLSTLNFNLRIMWVTAKRLILEGS